VVGAAFWQLDAQGAALMRLCLFVFAGVAAAHVGSPDVFYEGVAGPYPLFVAVRPPAAIPGVAEVQIVSKAADVERVWVTPLPLTGPAALNPPTPDLAARSRQDPNFYTGSLWLMTAGAWQVRVRVDGARGRGELAVPVPAVARSTKQMDTALGVLLAVLGALLAAGLVSIIGAAGRESALEPGVEPGPGETGRARRWSASALLVVVVSLVLGKLWWDKEAEAYDRYIYKPLALAAARQNTQLVLKLADPGWISSRRIDDLIADHGHLMHLFVVRLPGLDRIWHLHPEQRGPDEFAVDLPDMPAGRYQLYADIVHATGLPETLAVEVDLTAVQGRALAGDDSYGAGPPVSAAGFAVNQVQLPSGHRLLFEREASYTVRKPAWFRFRLLDSQGAPARDMQLYMGMLGHAVFLRADRGVFAHVHPSGSVPMASLALTREFTHPHAHGPLPDIVSFPFGFPAPGHYRIYVQVRHSGIVETGVFDLTVP
jgi:hypothetical protein